MCPGSESEERRAERGLREAYHKELKEISWEIVGTNFTEPFWPFFFPLFLWNFESEGYQNSKNILTTSCEMCWCGQCLLKFGLTWVILQLPEHDTAKSGRKVVEFRGGIKECSGQLWGSSLSENIFKAI